MTFSKFGSLPTWRELPLARDVAQGVHVAGGGVLEVVHLDAPLLVDLHAGVLQSQVGGGRRPPHGPQEALHVRHGGALVGLHAQLAVGALCHLLHLDIPTVSA